MRKQHSQSYRNYIRSAKWATKSKWVRSLTGERCCLFPREKAQETHHLTYRVKLGGEIPCWHLIPLCLKAHQIVHNPLLWEQPIRFFLNTYLRLIFIVLWTIANSCQVIVTWTLLYLLVILNQHFIRYNFQVIFEIIKGSLIK